MQSYIHIIDYSDKVIDIYLNIGINTGIITFYITSFRIEN